MTERTQVGDIKPWKTLPLYWSLIRNNSIEWVFLFSFSFIVQFGIQSINNTLPRTSILHIFPIPEIISYIACLYLLLISFELHDGNLNLKTIFAKRKMNANLIIVSLLSFAVSFALTTFGFPLLKNSGFSLIQIIANLILNAFIVAITYFVSEEETLRKSFKYTYEIITTNIAKFGGFFFIVFVFFIVCMLIITFPIRMIFPDIDPKSLLPYTTLIANTIVMPIYMVFIHKIVGTRIINIQET